MFSTHSEVHIESIQMLNPCFVMLGVPWLHSSKTTYQLAVLWLYSNLHPKHRLRHPNVLGLRRGQSQDHWNSSKFTPWPLRHGAAEQCCFKCSRVPVPSQKVHLHFLTNGVTVEWKIWRFDFCKCWRCNHGCCQFGISKRGFETKKSSTWWTSTSSWCPPEVTAASLWCLSTWRNTTKLLDLLLISLES